MFLEVIRVIVGMVLELYVFDWEGSDVMGDGIKEKLFKIGLKVLMIVGKELFFIIYVDL